MAHVVIMVLGAAFVGLFFLVAILCQPPTIVDDRLWPYDEDFFTVVDYW
jgi:hypothetical protein